MAKLTRRVQILLDDERYVRLERRAARYGASVAALIRDAIDLAYPADAPDRVRVAADFLAADPMPIADWNTADRAELLNRDQPWNG